MIVVMGGCEFEGCEREAFAVCVWRNVYDEAVPPFRWEVCEEHMHWFGREHDAGRLAVVGMAFMSGPGRPPSGGSPRQHGKRRRGR